MRRDQAPAGLEAIGAKLRRFAGTPFGRRMLLSLAAAAAFLLLGVFVSFARRRASASPAHQIRPEGIEVVGLPPWADPALARRFAGRALSGEIGDFSVPLFAPNAERLVADHLMCHPLVARVHAVEVSYPSRARVHLLLREPVARLRFAPRGGHSGSTELLLSSDGCLLQPESYGGYLVQLGRPLPYVVGIPSVPPLAPSNPSGPALALGERWEDPEERVAEAICAARLAARIHQASAGRVLVTGIDVSRFTRDGLRRLEEGEVRLLLSCPATVPGGPRVRRTVEWGRTDRARDRVVGEEEDREKLRRLKTHLSRARIPEPIDVRWWDVRGRAGGRL